MNTCYLVLMVLVLAGVIGFISDVNSKYTEVLDTAKGMQTKAE